MVQNDQDRFYRANVASQSIPNSIPPENIADALFKANQMVAQITFGQALIDRPEHGFNMHFIPSNEPGVGLPGDGYNWLDDEVTTSIPIDQARHLIVYEQTQGVVPGESFLFMARRRYQLLINHQPLQIQFIHYLTLDPSARIPINSSAPIKHKARRIDAISYDQIHHAVEQKEMHESIKREMHSSTPVPASKYPGTGIRAMGPPKRPSSANLTSSAFPPSSRRKTFHHTGGNGQYGEHESSSYHYDDSSTTTNRDIAVVRLIRNNQWLESLWSPFLNFGPGAAQDKNGISTDLGSSDIVNDLSGSTDKLTTLQDRVALLQSEVNVLEEISVIVPIASFPGPVRQWSLQLNDISTHSAWSSYIDGTVNPCAMEHGFGHVTTYSAVRSSKVPDPPAQSPIATTNEMDVGNVEHVRDASVTNSSLLGAEIDATLGIPHVPSRECVTTAHDAANHSPALTTPETGAKCINMDDYFNITDSSSLN